MTEGGSPVPERCYTEVQVVLPPIQRVAYLDYIKEWIKAHGLHLKQTFAVPAHFLSHLSSLDSQPPLFSRQHFINGAAH
jgi:hypothetical protein